MTSKEKFLSIKTYEEYDERRKEFTDLDCNDPEVINHFDEIFTVLESSGYKDGVITEAQKDNPKV